MGSPLILTGDVSAVGLDQGWTAIRLEHKGGVLPAHTEAPVPSSTPCIRKRMLIPSRTVGIDSGIQDFDIGDKALVPFTDYLIGEIIIVTEEMLLYRVICL